MLSHWPIRTKLRLGLGLLLITVFALFGSAYYGLYAYRSLVKGLSARSTELPLATEIQGTVSNLRVTLSQAQERVDWPKVFDSTPDQEPAWLGGQFHTQLGELVDALRRYSVQLDYGADESMWRLADNSEELQTLRQMFEVVAGIEANSPADRWDWVLNEVRLGDLRSRVEALHGLASQLPNHLYNRMHVLVGDVRSQYRTAITTAWVNLLLALVLLAMAQRVFYRWFADPLQALVDGSRMVAAGHFEHRIHLAGRDEIGELADAMNAMTERFCEIRDDLDRQVQERTSQVVRSEQLASVGFLAAGVSHEINNPLASIALCSESLEGRLEDLLQDVGGDHADDVEVVRNYLQMIQREAFRCKQITEKLLDFARRGDSQRHAADLRELAEGVIDMVQHLGQYHDKHIELLPGAPVIASVNPQEMKQVVLNLVTNGLESLDPGGRVRVAVERDARATRIIVEDNGCGMTDEVRKHLFEPFFTRRRSGQGTGLGLSITHRIVEEHHGRIEAASDGPGRGSRFVVSLPAEHVNKETHHRYQAA
ncbi:MAG: HAMP domain-containing histidine kinase [Pirellulales bacterium]|nr:HAMP domain-containing histidine kinase [Pirellulales bacterium]